MKKITIALIALLGMANLAHAQNYIVVNSETIFKSLDTYNSAISTIDKLGQQYQQTIDNAFEELEKLYNNYQSQRPYLNESARTAQESSILNREQEITEYQQKVFGQDGELIKKRIEILKPIQDKVFAAINSYAENNGYSLVIDIATNPTILYYAPSVDKTNEIINLIK